MTRHLALLAAFTLSACGIAGLLDPKAVQKDATDISKCEQVGRDCKADGGKDCYAQYEACTVDAGLRD